MLAKIKEKFFKKRVIVPLLAFFSFFILYPAKALAAFWVPFVVIPIITGISMAIGGFLAKALSALALIASILLFGWALSRAFMHVGLSFLNWGISGTFLSHGMSMTNPANNIIIQIGWTLLRDLTNMFFILGLAYIGLATALNFASFNTKKTFTTLIIIALLINFTPVICGLVVDGTNIIMNFFLSEVDFNSMADAYTGASKTLGKIQEDALKSDFSGTVLEYMLMSIYGILAGFVLMIFGCILLMRHFIIWVLVILSPLAFFCRIFDFSKQWYTKWWSYFVSWSFIGVPAAFFLYLANHLMVQAKTGQIIEANRLTEGLSAALTPYLITVLFMIIALITTLKIKTAGSGIVMNTANKLSTKAKSVPGLIQSKVAKPMGDKYGSLVKGRLMGAALGGAAKRTTEDTALKQGTAYTRGAAKRQVEKEALARGQKLSRSDKKQAIASILEKGKTNIQDTAIQKAEAAALAQGKGPLSQKEKDKIGKNALQQSNLALSEEKIKVGVEGGLRTAQESKRQGAVIKEKLGFKPREITDLAPDELRELANTPATSEEGLARKAGAMRKMIADDTMGLDQLKVLAQTPAVGKVDGALRAQAIKKLIDDDNFEYSPADAENMLSMMQAKYPGMNIQKLKKSRPDLVHLIDKARFDKEKNDIASGTTARRKPVTVSRTLLTDEEQARQNLIQRQGSKMGAEDFAKIDIDSMDDEDVLSLILSMDTGKVIRCGEITPTIRKKRIRKIVDDLMADRILEETDINEQIRMLDIGAAIQANPSFPS